MRSHPITVAVHCGKAVAKLCGQHTFSCCSMVYSQLLHSAVKLVLLCLPLRLQHAQSNKAAIMVLPRSTAMLGTISQG